MKVYKYIVNQITQKNKLIKVYERIVKSEMSQNELESYLQDKYMGLNIQVEYIEDVEEIHKPKYLSFEDMYIRSFKTMIKLEYSDDEDFKELLILNTKLKKAEDVFKKKVLDKIKSDFKYSSLLDKQVELHLQNTDKVILTGKVPFSDLGLIE